MRPRLGCMDSVTAASLPPTVVGALATESEPTSCDGRLAMRRRRAAGCLRIAASACFIGHGVFGVITKAAWLPYFGVLGIPTDVAYRVMPIIGAVDSIAGVTIILSPRPIVALYMTVWALWTALLRPMSGESIFETLERAGNYGVPLALLLLAQRPRSLGSWVWIW
jgi:hypothetical protein